MGVCDQGVRVFRWACSPGSAHYDQIVIHIQGWRLRRRKGHPARSQEMENPIGRLSETCGRRFAAHLFKWSTLLVGTSPCYDHSQAALISDCGMLYLRSVVFFGNNDAFGHPNQKLVNNIAVWEVVTAVARIPCTLQATAPFSCCICTGILYDKLLVGPQHFLARRPSLSR